MSATDAMSCPSIDTHFAGVVDVVLGDLNEYQALPRYAMLTNHTHPIVERRLAIVLESHLYPIISLLSRSRENQLQDVHV